MPFAAKFIIPTTYGSDHSAVVLNQQQITTRNCCLLHDAIMSGYVNVPIVSSAPGRPHSV